MFMLIPKNQFILVMVLLSLVSISSSQFSSFSRFSSSRGSFPFKKSRQNPPFKTLSVIEPTKPVTTSKPKINLFARLKIATTVLPLPSTTPIPTTSSTATTTVHITLLSTTTASPQSSTTSSIVAQQSSNPSRNKIGKLPTIRSLTVSTTPPPITTTRIRLPSLSSSLFNRPRPGSSFNKLASLFGRVKEVSTSESINVIPTTTATTSEVITTIIPTSVTRSRPTEQPSIILRRLSLPTRRNILRSGQMGQHRVEVQSEQVKQIVDEVDSRLEYEAGNKSTEEGGDGQTVDSGRSVQKISTVNNLLPVGKKDIYNDVRGLGRRFRLPGRKNKSLLTTRLSSAKTTTKSSNLLEFSLNRKLNMIVSTEKMIDEVLQFIPLPSQSTTSSFKKPSNERPPDFNQSDLRDRLRILIVATMSSPHSSTISLDTKVNLLRKMLTEQTPPRLRSHLMSSQFTEHARKLFLQQKSLSPTNTVSIPVNMIDDLLQSMEKAMSSEELSSSILVPSRITTSFINKPLNARTPAFNQSALKDKLRPLIAAALSTQHSSTISLDKKVDLLRKVLTEQSPPNIKSHLMSSQFSEHARKLFLQHKSFSANNTVSIIPTITITTTSLNQVKTTTQETTKSTTSETFTTTRSLTVSPTQSPITNTRRRLPSLSSSLFTRPRPMSSSNKLASLFGRVSEESRKLGITPESTTVIPTTTTTTSKATNEPTTTIRASSSKVSFMTSTDTPLLNPVKSIILRKVALSSTDSPVVSTASPISSTDFSDSSTVPDLSLTVSTTSPSMKRKIQSLLEAPKRNVLLNTLVALTKSKSTDASLLNPVNSILLRKVSLSSTESPVVSTASPISPIDTNVSSIVPALTSTVSTSLPSLKRKVQSLPEILKWNVVLSTPFTKSNSVIQIPSRVTDGALLTSSRIASSHFPVNIITGTQASSKSSTTTKQLILSKSATFPPIRINLTTTPIRITTNTFTVTTMSGSPITPSRIDGKLTEARLVKLFQSQRKHTGGSESLTQKNNSPTTASNSSMSDSSDRLTVPVLTLTPSTVSTSSSVTSLLSMKRKVQSLTEIPRRNVLLNFLEFTKSKSVTQTPDSSTDGTHLSSRVSTVTSQQPIVSKTVTFSPIRITLPTSRSTTITVARTSSLMVGKIMSPRLVKLLKYQLELTDINESLQPDFNLESTGITPSSPTRKVQTIPLHQEQTTPTTNNPLYTTSTRITAGTRRPIQLFTPILASTTTTEPLPGTAPSHVLSSPSLIHSTPTTASNPRSRPVKVFIPSPPPKLASSLPSLATPAVVINQKSAVSSSSDKDPSRLVLPPVLEWSALDSAVTIQEEFSQTEDTLSELQRKRKIFFGQGSFSGSSGPVEASFLPDRAGNIHLVTRDGITLASAGRGLTIPVREELPAGLAQTFRITPVIISGLREAGEEGLSLSSMVKRTRGRFF